MENYSTITYDTSIKVGDILKNETGIPFQVKEYDSSEDHYKLRPYSNPARGNRSNWYEFLVVPTDSLYSGKWKKFLPVD